MLLWLPKGRRNNTPVTLTSVLIIYIKTLKTDLFCLGVDMYFDQTQKVLCQVAAVYSRDLAHYLKFLMDYRLFCPKVKEALLTGTPYSGHRFRIGETIAGSRGDHYKHTQEVVHIYQLYIKTPWEHLAAVLGRLVASSLRMRSRALLIHHN